MKGSSLEFRPASVGVALRRARMERGHTPEEMADALHVPVRYIDAIESDDFAALPPSVYARALIRSYARLVGVNPAEVSEHAVPVRPQDRNPIRPAVEPLEKPPLVSWRAIWTAGLLVAALCLFVYLYSQYNSFARSVDQTGGSLIVENLPTPATRNLGEQSWPIWSADFGLGMSLTGSRSWHSLVPEVKAGVGFMSDFKNADVGGFKYGTRFALTWGAAMRFVPGGRYQLRADFSNRLTSIRYPDVYFRPATGLTAILAGKKDQSVWRNNPSISIGISYLFSR